MILGISIFVPTKYWQIHFQILHDLSNCPIHHRNARYVRRWIMFVVLTVYRKIILLLRLIIKSTGSIKSAIVGGDFVVIKTDWKVYERIKISVNFMLKSLKSKKKIWWLKSCNTTMFIIYTLFLGMAVRFDFLH